MKYQQKNVGSLSSYRPSRIIKFYLLLFSVLLTLFFSANAQDLNESVMLLSQDAAQEYVSPIADAFGANLNAGWFNKAPDAEILGVDVKLGLVFMGSFLSEESQFFSVGGQYRFTNSQARDLAAKATSDPTEQAVLVEEIISQDFSVQISGPTVIGSESENIIVKTDQEAVQAGGQTFIIPASDVIVPVTGLIEDPGILPTAAPQLTFGTVYGTQGIIRYLPDVEISSEIGKLKYFGFGIQHNPAVWLANPIPVDIALGFFTQKLEIGSIFDTKTTAAGINVSKTFSGVVASVTPYAGFMIEKSTMELNYSYIFDPNRDPIQVNFEIEGANKSRLTLGALVNLLGLKVAADYNLGTIKNFSVSILYGF